MKFSLASLFLVVGVIVVVVIPSGTWAAVPKPDISVGLNVGHDTNVGTLGGVTPRIQWQSEPTIVLGCDVQGGIDVTVTDVQQTPATFVWGKLKKTIGGIGGGTTTTTVLTVRGEMDVNTRDVIDLDIQASGFDGSTGLKITGSAGTTCPRVLGGGGGGGGGYDLIGPSVMVDTIQVSKRLNALGGTLNVNPSYSVSKGTPDAVVGYTYGPTSMKINAQQKQLTVSHTFSQRNTITPTVSIGSGSEFSLSYTRRLNDGVLTTTWKPDDSIKLQWSDTGWDATFVAPLEGYYNANGGVKVSMRRTIDVPL